MDDTLKPIDLNSISPEDLAFQTWRLEWDLDRRTDQTPPDGDWWTIWLLLAGRGAGKTRTSAETIGRWAWQTPGTRILVSAPTYLGLTGLCMEGKSGLLNVIPRKLIAKYNKSDIELELVNGTLIKGISAENPERFRGFEFEYAWLDEYAAWQYPGPALDMIMFGMRLGAHPRIIISTTPQPKKEVRALIMREGKDVVITRASTYANLANLSPNHREQLLQYEGTALGRQEIHAELLDPEEQGIIRRSWFNLWPANKALPTFDFIVVSLDTAYTEETRDKKSGKTDPTACSVWGLFYDDEKPRIMLLECWEERLGFPDLLKKIPIEMSAKYGEQQEALIKSNWGKPLISEKTGGKKPDLLLIEDKGSGISLRQMLEREHIISFAYNPGRASKLARLHAVSHIFSNGLVYVKESVERHGNPVPWAEALISQVCSYSGEGTTEHDDYVDSLSQAIRYLIDRDFISIAKPPERDEDDEDELEIDRGNPYTR